MRIGTERTGKQLSNVFWENKKGKRVEQKLEYFFEVGWLANDIGCVSSCLHRSMARSSKFEHKVIPCYQEQRSLPEYHEYNTHVDLVNEWDSNMHRVWPRDVRARLDTRQTRKLIDMGFAKPLLARVIGRRLLDTGQDFDGFVEFFLAAKSEEFLSSEGEIDTLRSYYERTMERLFRPASMTETHPSGNMEQQTSPDCIEKGSTNDKNDTRGFKDCNVCMDAAIDVVLLPCRHLCSCSSCAEKLGDCPLCRKRIERTIKVFT